MRSRLCKAITKESRPISVLIDESTTSARKSCLIVYVRTKWPGKKSDGCFAFPLGIVELDASTAQHILDKLLAVLTKTDLMKHISITT